MRTYDCFHSCMPVAPGWALYTIVVNGLMRSFLKARGNCHDAAYMAQMWALTMARNSGIRSVTVRTTSTLVREQLNGRWRARKAGMKRNLAACRTLEGGMNIVYA